MLCLIIKFHHPLSFVTFPIRKIYAESLVPFHKIQPDFGAQLFALFISPPRILDREFPLEFIRPNRFWVKLDQLPSLPMRDGPWHACQSLLRPAQFGALASNCVRVRFAWLKGVTKHSWQPAGCTRDSRMAASRQKHRLLNSPNSPYSRNFPAHFPTKVRQILPPIILANHSSKNLEFESLGNSQILFRVPRKIYSRNKRVISWININSRIILRRSSKTRKIL